MRFSWRLLIFPHGTAVQDVGKTTAAFVELVPDVRSRSRRFRSKGFFELKAGERHEIGSKMEKR